MRYITLCLIILTMLLGTACEDGNPLISEQDLVVVQAYLYAGEPVDDIRLTSTLPLDEDTSKALPINDAQVVLMKNGTRFECVSTPGDSGYYHYPGDDLQVQTGDRFQLEIKYHDQFITAKAVVPEPPESVTLSANTIAVPSLEDFSTMREWRFSENAEDLEVSWDQESNAWYYVTLKNLEENPVEIETFIRDTLRTFVFPPVNDTSYRFRFPLLTHLGTHEVKVYRVNTEYVDLYTSRLQDSRDLNEPLTNINGGLGVFTAFNYGTCHVEVVLYESET